MSVQDLLCLFIVIIKIVVLPINPLNGQEEIKEVGLRGQLLTPPLQIQQTHRTPHHKKPFHITPLTHIAPTPVEEETLAALEDPRIQPDAHRGPPCPVIEIPLELPSKKGLVIKKRAKIPEIRLIGQLLAGRDR